MAAYYRRAQAGRPPCLQHVNTDWAKRITRWKLWRGSQRALRTRVSSVQQCFGSCSLKVLSEQTAASVLSEDRLSRSSHATLNRDREAEASSCSHSSPHLTLSIYTCRFAIRQFYFNIYFTWYKLLRGLRTNPHWRFPNLSSPCQAKVYHLSPTTHPHVTSLTLS